MQLLFRPLKAGEEAGGDVAGCAHEVLDTVLPVIWFIRRHMRGHRRGLSMPQFRTLCAVEQQPAMSLSNLADHLGASMPTASRIVGGLVGKGLLVRTGCKEDRRVLALALTAEGREVLDSAWVAAQQNMEEPLLKLGVEERATVTAAMGLLRGLFGSAGLREPMAGEKSNGHMAVKQETVVKPSRREVSGERASSRVKRR